MMATERRAWTYRDGKVYEGTTVIADDVENGNGRIIAAAPDLLEALKGLVRIIQEFGGCNQPEYEKAWAAIAKAEGKGLCTCPDPDCPGKWPGTPEDSWRCKAEGK